MIINPYSEIYIILLRGGFAAIKLFHTRNFLLKYPGPMRGGWAGKSVWGPESKEGNRESLKGP